MLHMTTNYHTGAQDVLAHLSSAFPGTEFTVKVRDTKDQRRLSVSWSGGPTEIFVMSALPAPKLPDNNSPFDVVSATREARR